MSRNHTVARNGAKNKLDRKKLNFKLTWSRRQRRRDAASMASMRPRVDGVETSRCDVVGAVAASYSQKKVLEATTARSRLRRNGGHGGSRASGRPGRRPHRGFRPKFELTLEPTKTRFSTFAGEVVVLLLLSDDAPRSTSTTLFFPLSWNSAGLVD